MDFTDPKFEVNRCTMSSVQNNPILVIKSLISQFSTCPQKVNDHFHRNEILTELSIK